MTQMPLLHAWHRPMGRVDATHFRLHVTVVPSAAATVVLAVYCVGGFVRGRCVLGPDDARESVIHLVSTIDMAAADIPSGMAASNELRP
jgi:hypothetical protein